MYDRLLALCGEHERLSREMATEEIATDQQRYRSHAKKVKSIGETVQGFRRYQRIEKHLAEAEQMLREETDPELRLIAEEERDNTTKQLQELEQELRILLIPKDPNDDKNIIVEIRAGTGGDESALFAGDLLRMYSRYAERQRWSVELVSSSPSELGGYREVIARIVDEHFHGPSRTN